MVRTEKFLKKQRLKKFKSFDYKNSTTKIRPKKFDLKN